MPITQCPTGEWTAVAQEADGTRVEARGTGFYVTTDVAPVDGDFGTAIALASGESLFVDDGAAALFVHPSNSVHSAFVYTTGGISQVTNAT